MLKVLRERIRQGKRTVRFPKGIPTLPERFRGVPEFDPSKCSPRCNRCAAACPIEAISVVDGNVVFDLGRCLFCADCVAACPSGAISHTREFRMAARTRDGLSPGTQGLQLAQALDKSSRAVFGRSIALRQVSAGGCNACESDINVLGTVVYDLGRFGIQMVASPRHADGLLVTGPVTNNMRQALIDTYEAVPRPKIVIAVGACAISGGPFRGQSAVCNGADGAVPVDLYIPGCPPHPLTILDGLLRLLGRLK